MPNSPQTHSSDYSSPSPSSSKQESLPEVLTYRLNDKMVYVTPALDYEQALDFAYAVYPDGLRGVPRDRVHFSIIVVMSGENRISRIGPMAWNVVVSTLNRYDIVEITVQHEGNPPHYSSAINEQSDEKSSSHLQPSSPSRRSPSPSPSRKNIAREWLDKFL